VASGQPQYRPLVRLRRTFSQHPSTSESRFFFAPSTSACTVVLCVSTKIPTTNLSSTVFTWSLTSAYNVRYIMLYSSETSLNHHWLSMTQYVPPRFPSVVYVPQSKSSWGGGLYKII